jgi:acyl-[acyl-carrier-protein]-phospholipid O-acyltransferase/long-chain-fatty-acid--[acyl-carrier-protein] ligase
VGESLSFKNGRLLWHWPQQFPHPVTVSFGAPLPGNVRAPQVRQAIMELASQAVVYRRQPHDLLHLRFLRTVRRRLWAFCMADATDRRYRGYAALAQVCRLTRWLRAQVPEESRLGLMLPPAATTALTHVAALCAGTVPVPLPPDLPRQILLTAIQQADIHMVVTSRERAAVFQNIPHLTLLCLEDACLSLHRWQHIATTLLVLIVPSWLWQRWYRYPGQHPMGLATVVFTSGSSGPPKGVMLSHHNILSNLESIAQIFELTGRDCMLGSLPLHHAFGLTVTVWLPFISGFGIVYQAETLDAPHLIAQVQRYKTTFLVSTPADYRHYLQHCPTTALTSLRHAISGADALPADLTVAFQATYGLPLLEGYGCTEMAPVIAVNVPDAAYGSRWQTGAKPSTVGHPLPGVAAKVVHPCSGAVLPYGEEGLFLVQGPNRMLGYLGAPERTAAVLRDGWFVTGDMGSMDEDGFLRITGRLPHL